MMQVGLSVEGNLHLQQRPCVGRKCRSAAFVQSLCRLNIGKMSRMMTVMTPFSGRAGVALVAVKQAADRRFGLHASFLPLPFSSSVPDPEP